MTAAKPETEQERLFNRYFSQADDGLFWSERAEFATALWRARSLARRAPDDFVTRVLECGFSLKSGDRDSADSAATAAFRLRQPGIAPAQGALCRCLLALGRFEEAIVAARDLTGPEELRRRDPSMNIAPHVALIAGDIAFLRELANLHGSYHGIDVAGLLLATLEESGIADHLHEHQRIVNRTLIQATEWITVNVFDEEDMPPLVRIMYFMNISRNLKDKMQSNITDDLFDYYREKGLPPAPYLGYLVTDISSPNHRDGELAAE